MRFNDKQIVTILMITFFFNSFLSLSSIGMPTGVSNIKEGAQGNVDQIHRAAEIHTRSLQQSVNNINELHKTPKLSQQSSHAMNGEHCEDSTCHEGCCAIYFAESLGFWFNATSESEKVTETKEYCLIVFGTRLFRPPITTRV